MGSTSDEQREFPVRRRLSLGKSMQWDASLPDDLVERIWRNPNGLLADGLRLQDKPRCSVTRIDGDGGSFVWKRHSWGGVGRTLRKIWSKPVAKKCWADGRHLAAAGVPTPRPRLYLERRLGPVNVFSYLLSDYVEGVSLYRYLRYQEPGDDELRQLAPQVAAIWQRLDDLNIQHNDFQTENFLVDPAGKLWLIDMERLRRCRHKEETRRRQIRDIEDFLHPRNWRANSEAADLFRRQIRQTPAATEALATAAGAAHPLSRPAPMAARKSQLITVLIPTLNAADSIFRCLESVREMADEILVADAGSTDDTVAIARSFDGCRVIEKQSLDPVAFESWACAQARHSWILRVLPNEQVNVELAREVPILTASETVYDALVIPRSIYFRGRPLNYGGVERRASVRLFRKDAVRFEFRNGEVEVVPCCERVGLVRYPLVVESCRNIRVHVDDMLREAVHAAETAHAGRQPPSMWTALIRTPWRFVKSYFLQGGWLDGWAGLHNSVLLAFAVYLRDAMLWDRQQPGASSAESDETPKFKVFPASAEPSTATIAYPGAAAAEVPSRDAHERRKRPAA